MDAGANGLLPGPLNKQTDHRAGFAIGSSVTVSQKDGATMPVTGSSPPEQTVYSDVETVIDTKSGLYNFINP